MPQRHNKQVKPAHVGRERGTKTKAPSRDSSSQKPVALMNEGTPALIKMRRVLTHHFILRKYVSENPHSVSKRGSRCCNRSLTGGHDCTVQAECLLW